MNVNLSPIALRINTAINTSSVTGAVESRNLYHSAPGWVVTLGQAVATMIDINLTNNNGLLTMTGDAEKVSLAAMSFYDLINCTKAMVNEGIDGIKSTTVRGSKAVANKTAATTIINDLKVAMLTEVPAAPVVTQAAGDLAGMLTKAAKPARTRTRIPNSGAAKKSQSKSVVA